MKKIHIASLALLTAVFGYGCLGSTGEDIIGTWKLAPVNPMANPVEMTIQNGGTVIFTDPITLMTDTGEWELSPNIENNRLTISGVDPSEFQSPWNAEWHILKINEDVLLIAAKGSEFGGVLQQDFVRQ